MLPCSRKMDAAVEQIQTTIGAIEGFNYHLALDSENNMSANLHMHEFFELRVRALLLRASHTQAVVVSFFSLSNMKSGLILTIDSDNIQYRFFMTMHYLMSPSSIPNEQSFCLAY